MAEHNGDDPSSALLEEQRQVLLEADGGASGADHEADEHEPDEADGRASGADHELDEHEPDEDLMKSFADRATDTLGKYDLSICFAKILLVCGFPCADVITDYTQALPALYEEEDKTSFYMQLMVLITAAAVGAVTYTQEHSTWPQLPSQPGFKAAYALFITAVFPLYPYEVVGTAAVAWLTGNRTLLQDCVPMAQSAAANELMEAVLSFGLQSHAYFNNGVAGVLPSLVCGLACLVKCALEQNTNRKVYWAFTMKGEDAQTVKRDIPILTGPLLGLVSEPHLTLILGIHYLCEIISGTGCIVLFHHIAHDPFVVPLLHGSLAWMVFMAAQALLILCALRRTSLLSTPQTLPAACTGQFFIQLPILDASVPVLPSYAARFAGQVTIAILLILVYTQGEVEDMIALLATITCIASGGMAVTFAALRRCVALDAPTHWQRRSIQEFKEQIDEDLRLSRRGYTWCDLTPAQVRHPTMQLFLQECFQGHEHRLKTADDLIALSMSHVSVENCEEELVAVYVMDGALEALSGLVTCPLHLDATHRYLHKMIINGEQRAKSVPATIGHLQALKELEISECPSLSWLPAEIGQLEMLQKLSILDCNMLNKLPPELGQLRALVELKVSKCSKLNSLFPELAQMQALQRLEVSGCEKLSSLPAELGQSKTLQNLIISDCCWLQSIPPELGRLKTLLEFKVANCGKLSSLPKELGKLQTLQTLEISDCEELSSLPTELGHLQALLQLRIADCEKLGFFPPELGQLRLLQKLAICGCNKFSSLPAELGQLRSLEKLEISRCWNLSALPKELGQLKALKELKISDCRELGSLPEELDQAEALSKLVILFCGKLSPLTEKLQGLRD